MHLRTLAADFIRYIHIGLFLFLISGWSCPSPSVLKTHALLIPLLIVHWRTNNNTCFLTNLEHWVRGGKTSHEEQRGSFVKSIVENTCGISPSDSVLEACIYLTMISLMTISFWRLGAF